MRRKHASTCRLSALCKVTGLIADKCEIHHIQKNWLVPDCMRALRFRVEPDAAPRRLKREGSSTSHIEHRDKTGEPDMSNIVLLFLCMAAGMGLRRADLVPANAHLTINTFIIYISLPALTLLQLHGIKLQPALVYAIAMPWLLFAGGACFFWTLAKAMRFSPSTTGGLMLSAGLGNTSFVGVPMIEAFYGASGMAIGILIDQLGTYLVLSTVGVAIAALYSSGKASGADVIRRVSTFPPFIALVAALLLSPLEYPALVINALHRLGDTLTPLALVSVGLQLRFDELKDVRIPLAAGLSFKLLIGPALLVLFYVDFMGASGDVVQITLFESAMGPQIGASIVAIQHGLNPPLITLLVGIGITLSFLTLPIWWYVLQGI
jgi:malate permease and related proteins